ncbi:MAG TPA: histidinol-phosphate transaminase [Spirochaetia bacterium]|nr:histidinol-phosphate transaminase [Spirochaetia bacterium]
MKVRSAVTRLDPYIPGALKAGAVKLASNENPFGPSPLAIDAIVRDAATVNLYPDQHANRLRQKLSAVHNIPADQLIIGDGSDEIMAMITGTYLESGDNVITAANTFSTYTYATLLFGGQMRTVPLAEGRFDLPAIAAAIDSRTRATFICNPNNPTGTYVTDAELRSFLEKVPKSVVVVLDEAYVEFATASDFPDSLSLLAEYPNLIVLRTFSKIYGLAGLRVGYGIASTSMIADLNRVKQPFNVGLLSQIAAAAALDDSAFVERSLANNRAGKETLYKALDDLGLSYYRTQSNFVCIETNTDAKALFRRVAELGVTIRPLASFGLPTAIRVTIGTPEQLTLFLQCFEQALSESRLPG